MSAAADRIAVISIRRRIENPSELSFKDLYSAIGANTGNLLFTNAVFEHIDADIHRIDFSFNPSDINRQFDCVVLPAANWINATSNWDFLVNTIEQLTIPVITLGIGLQASSPNTVVVNDSSLRLVSVLSKKAKFLSVRGYFTRDWLFSIGIKNVVATGCPSLYWNVPVKVGGEDASDIVVLQGTRFFISKEFVHGDSINKRLYQLAGRSGLWLIYQSEVEEMRFLTFGSFVQEDETREEDVVYELMQLYGISDRQSLEAFVKSRGRVFWDVGQWAGFLKNARALVGTRIHGCILGLNTGIRACIIPHDMRTRELAEFGQLPQLDPASIQGNMSVEEIERVVMSVDTSTYFEARRKNALTYVEFLRECGLRVREENVAC